MVDNIYTADDGTFSGVIASASPEVRTVARAVRKLIADVMPGVTEVAWPQERTAGYWVGPKKMSEHFCYVAPHNAHVNLGFFYGVDLHDPENLLEGDGKSLRHIKIRTLANLENPALREILDRASKYLPKLAKTELFQSK